jgi:superfamily I DNA/RNA helicase
MPSTATSSALEPNPEQQRIIDYQGDYLQVIAYAGSGRLESLLDALDALVEAGGGKQDRGHK